MKWSTILFGLNGMKILDKTLLDEFVKNAFLGHFCTKDDFWGTKDGARRGAKDRQSIEDIKELFTSFIAIALALKIGF